MTLEEAIHKIGARIKISEEVPGHFRLRKQDLAVNVRYDDTGPFFQVLHKSGTQLSTKNIELQSKNKKLLIKIWLNGYELKHLFFCENSSTPVAIEIAEPKITSIKEVEKELINSLCGEF